MKIPVTQKHIDGADPNTTDNCMVARALTDAGYSNIIVGVRVAWLGNKRHELSDDVYYKILNYAGPHHVKSEPFEFELEIPE